MPSAPRAAARAASSIALAVELCPVPRKTGTPLASSRAAFRYESRSSSATVAASPVDPRVTRKSAPRPPAITRFTRALKAGQVDVAGAEFCGAESGGANIGARGGLERRGQGDAESLQSARSDLWLLIRLVPVRSSFFGSIAEQRSMMSAATSSKVKIPLRPFSQRRAASAPFANRSRESASCESTRLSAPVSYRISW